jgi:hypothetical protein
LKKSVLGKTAQLSVRGQPTKLMTGGRSHAAFGAARPAATSFEGFFNRPQRAGRPIKHAGMYLLWLGLALAVLLPSGCMTWYEYEFTKAEFVDPPVGKR